MEDKDKSREQLVEELAQMRRYLAALESSKDTRGSTEDALWEGGEYYRLLVESVKDYAIFMLDSEGRVTSWNEGARRIKGYEAEEIVGEHFSIFYLPEDIERDHPGEVLRRAVEEDSYEEENLRVRKDGSRFWASVVITALREEGDLRGFAKVVRDVTERKRSDETLRWQAELLELSHEPILAWELGGGIVYWNRGCEELYGFPEEEVLGRDIHRLLQTAHPVPLGQVEAALERAGRWVGELEHTTRDGRRVIVESRQVLVHTADGRRLVQETNRDITDRRRAEEALREIREAERRRIARDLHDMVLQDLSGVLQALQLARLQARRLGSDLDDLGEEIEALRRAAAGLRNAIYDLRSEDERPFVHAVETLVESERRRAPEREIDLSVQEGFPQESAGAVGTELLRIIREALTNVRRHSGSGRAEVNLGAEEGQVRIEVADDGRGFDPDETSETLGGGAGLPGMRERVEALGGRFEIRGRPGEGTRVTARIPF